MKHETNDNARDLNPRYRRQFERQEKNKERRQKAIDRGIPWYVDHGGGRGKWAEPTVIYTTEDDPTFIAEVGSPADGNMIVELLAALIEAKAALSLRAVEAGPAFEAYKRADRVITRVMQGRAKAGG